MELPTRERAASPPSSAPELPLHPPARRDPRRDGAIGLFIGLVATAILLAVGERGGFGMLRPVLPLVPVAAAAATAVAVRFEGALGQLLRFSVVGCLNVLVDIGTLHLLLALARADDAPSTATFAAAKAVAFVVALAHSYLWNRIFTFGGEGRHAGSPLREAAAFAAVSTGGLAIDVCAATLLVALVGPRESIGAGPLATAAALVGTVACVGWNFLGYRYLVFRAPEHVSET